MGILDDLGYVVDRADSDLGLLEEYDVLRLRVLADEGADDGVEFLRVLHPAGIGAETRVLNEVGAANGAKEALGHALGRAGHGDILAVLAPLGVARGRRGPAAPHARL